VYGTPFHLKGRTTEQISRELQLARNAVRSIVRGEEMERLYLRARNDCRRWEHFPMHSIRCWRTTPGGQAGATDIQRLYETLRLSVYSGGGGTSTTSELAERGSGGAGERRSGGAAERGSGGAGERGSVTSDAILLYSRGIFRAGWIDTPNYTP
jgi:hypothetical protein